MSHLAQRCFWYRYLSVLEKNNANDQLIVVFDVTFYDLKVTGSFFAITKSAYATHKLVRIGSSDAVYQSTFKFVGVLWIVIFFNQLEQIDGTVDNVCSSAFYYGFAVTFDRYRIKFF